MVECFGTNWTSTSCEMTLFFVKDFSTTIYRRCLKVLHTICLGMTYGRIYFCFQNTSAFAVHNSAHCI